MRASAVMKVRVVQTPALKWGIQPTVVEAPNLNAVHCVRPVDRKHPKAVAEKVLDPSRSLRAL